MSANDRIQGRLVKSDLRGTCLSVPQEREELIRGLSALRGVKSHDVRQAVEIFARYQAEAKTPCITTKKQRDQLAVLISRQGIRNDGAKVPFARAVRHARERLYSKTLNFKLSSGGPTRKFDSSRLHLVADSASKRKAKRFASVLRRKGFKSVRTIPYSHGWSVYSERPVMVATKKQMRKDPKAGYPRRRNIVQVPKTPSAMGIRLR